MGDSSHCSNSKIVLEQCDKTFLKKEGGKKSKNDKKREKERKTDIDIQNVCSMHLLSLSLSSMLKIFMYLFTHLATPTFNVFYRHLHSFGNTFSNRFFDDACFSLPLFWYRFWTLSLLDNMFVASFILSLSLSLSLPFLRPSFSPLLLLPVLRVMRA